MYKNLNEVLEDKELLVSLVEAQTANEFGKILADKEIALDGLTNEEAFKLFKEQEGKELNEDELAEVSGGIALTVALGAAGAFTLAGGALSFLGGYAYQKYQNWKKKK